MGSHSHKVQYYGTEPCYCDVMMHSLSLSLDKKYSACIVTSQLHRFVGSLSKKKHKHTTGTIRTGFILDNHHSVYWILTAQFIHEEIKLYILIFNEQKSLRHKYLF